MITVGDYCRHIKYGIGVVIEILFKNKKKCLVRFDSGLEKQFKPSEIEFANQQWFAQY